MIIRHIPSPAVNIFTDWITALILRRNTTTFCLMMQILNTDYSAFQIGNINNSNKKHGCIHKYPVQLSFPEFQFELPRKPFFSSPLLSNPVFHCSPDIIERCIWASACAASSCVGGAPSSGLTAGSWRELWLDASQTVGDLHLPARWLWCRATTHHSGHRKSSRTAAHRLWPSNTTEHHLNNYVPEPKFKNT